MYDRNDIMKLAHYCQKGLEGSVKAFLDNIPYKLDLTAENGEVIAQALTGKSVKITNMVLDYYDQKILSCDRESMEYKLAKHKLYNVINEVLDSYPVRSEIESIISSRYLTDSFGSSDVNSDLDDFDFSSDDTSYEPYNSLDSSLSTENINKLNAFNNDVLAYPETNPHAVVTELTGDSPNSDGEIIL